MTDPTDAMADATAVAPPSCLLIGPIGDSDAPIGQPKYETWVAAQEVLEKITEPACARFGITPLRADKISRVGEIPEQVFVALRDRDLVIADMTDANPNVMYELALRHAVGKCAILIGEYEKLPFDVTWVRAIEFTRTDLGLVNGRKKLEAAIETFMREGCDRITATRIIRDGGAEAPAPPPGTEEASEEAEADAPGFVDLVAEMEDAMPRLTAKIEEAGVEIQHLGNLAERSSAEMEEVDAQSGGSMSARLPLIARFAAAINESADRLEAVAADYAADIKLVDGGISALLDRMEEEPELQGEAPDFLPNLIQLAETSTEAFASSDSMADSTDKLGSLARVMRQPTRRVATGLRNLRIISAPVFTWAERAAAISRS